MRFKLLTVSFLSLFSCFTTAFAQTPAPVLGGTSQNPAGTAFALILIYSSTDAVGLCSGTLVGEQYVLTAGHCIHSEYGAYNHVVWIGGGWHRAAAVAAHPQYIESDIGNEDPHRRMMNLYTDVGIIQLLDTITTVNPLPILINEIPQVGNYLSIFGYGTSESAPGSNPANMLRAATVRISDLDSAAFAARYSVTHTAACHGDSGGPVVKYMGSYRGILGVTSQGDATSVTDSGICYYSGGDMSLFPLLQSNIVLPFLKNFSGVQYISGRLVRFAQGLPALQTLCKQGIASKDRAIVRQKARRLLSGASAIRRYGDSRRRNVLARVTTNTQNAYATQSLADAHRFLRAAGSDLSKLRGFSVIVQ
jgi:hypothetical protein